MFTIKSITGQVHDTNPGPLGYPYKIVVMIDIPVAEFNKLCPKHKGRSSRDLGTLVAHVNNAVYDLNRDIPAHNPSIDSQGHRRARKGVKTMEFVYFLRDHSQAARLGFEQHKFKSGEISPKYGQYIDLNVESKTILKVV